MRQRTLAGEVAGACVVSGWHPGWFPAGSVLRPGRGGSWGGALW